ncbi:MAG: adenine phosphoribosyltransferase [Planctomycetota bacterium]|nr:MAG: adenine phosphoribosyltransferase [Planctomycetota bacterium]
MNLKKYIRDIPDFPKPGILFKDITPLLHHPQAFAYSIDQIVQQYSNTPLDYVCGIESRGFIFASTIAYKLNLGFIPIRKVGKLPGKTQSIQYQLEYGTDELQIHEDALQNNDKVLLVDDLLATGGTMYGACQLVESLGAQIQGCAFLVELAFLSGKEKLKKWPTFSLIEFS